MPGNMGMNAWLGKSNCHSSFPLFLPSLLHYRQMTGQSCRRSLCCFSSIRHHSITSCSLISSSNKSLCLLMSSFVSVRLVCLTSRSVPPAYFVTLFSPLFLFFCSSLPLFCLCMPMASSLFLSPSDGFSPLFSFPSPPLLIPLSSSLQHSTQSISWPPPPSLYPSLNPLVPSVVPLSPDFLQSSPSRTPLYLHIPFLL